jgi:hypothetical protein
MSGEFETIDHRPRYRLCRLGLIFAAGASAIMAADSAGFLAFLLSWDHRLFKFLTGPVWQWGAGSAIVWCALIGSLALCGRWREADWPRRSGTLLTLAVLGVGLWVLQHGDEFGLVKGEVPDHWLRDMIRLGARWWWMLLLAGLAADVALHLGREEADDARGTIYFLVGSAAFLWVIWIIHQTDWAHGWPLRGRAWITPITWLLWLGISALRAFGSFALTTLCLLAARGCTDILRELDRAARGEHLFDAPHAA